MDLITTQLTLNAVASPVLVYANTRLLFCNTAAQHLLGYDTAALPPLPAIIHPDFHHLVCSPESLPSQPLEIILQPAHDPPLWVEMALAPFDYNGQPAVLGTIQTDRMQTRQTQEMLRQREVHLDLAIQSARAGVWDLDLHTGAATWSDENHRLLGYVPGNVKPSLDNWLRAVHPDDRETLRQSQLTALQQQQEIDDEYRVIWPDGSIHWLHDLGKTLAGTTGKPERLIGLTFDITASKQAEEALRLSESRLKLALAAVNAGTWDWDLHTNKTFWSDENFRLMGYEPGSCEPTRDIWLEHVYPEDREQANTLRLISDGITATEYRVVWPDNSLHWVLDLGKTLYDANGSAERVIGLKLDITQRKQMETTLLEQARLRAELQTEQAVSQLKTRLMERISHEFRTPMTIIAMSGEMLERYFDRMTPDQRRERLQQIRAEIKRMKQMMDDVALALQGKFDQLDFRPAPFDLEALCYSVAARTAQAYGVDDVIQITVRGDLTAVMGDRQRVELILTNLLTNALKYSPPNTPVLLAAYRKVDEVVLTVTDHGPGIDPQDQPHIFEPFFRGARSSEQVSGLGLGLRIAQDAAAAHGGTITVASAIGQGASFTVRLPLSGAVPADHALQVCS